MTTPTVLVVEDEPSMRFLCRVNLEMTGYEVLEAATGLEALERADTPGLDLVLLDVMLPDIRRSRGRTAAARERGACVRVHLRAREP